MPTIFGPVPSRRLGRSLGIDVVPHKTCTYNCVYCEAGPTTCLTLDRQAFLDPDRVLGELADYFRNHPGSVDVLTFAGAGEPTLYLPLGDLIREIKKRYPSYPLMVLTNGSLLWDPSVRRDLMEADRVVPSLDATIEEVFRRVNRPHPRLKLSRILEGLFAFRQEYPRPLHVEVALVRGVNESRAALENLRDILDALDPPRVELNTVVRPPAVPGVMGLEPHEMEKARRILGRGRTEIIGSFLHPPVVGSDANLEERILAMIRRRPCDPQEMARSLAVEPHELESASRRLRKKGVVSKQRFGDREYLVPSEK